MPRENLPAYSILGLHYQRHKRIQWWLDEWAKQNPPPRKMVLVDDGSDDLPDVNDFNSHEIEFVLIQTEHDMNLSKMLNIGYKHIETPWFCEMGTDCRPTEDFAYKCIARSIKHGPMTLVVGNRTNMWEGEANKPKKIWKRIKAKTERRSKRYKHLQRQRGGFLPPQGWFRKRSEWLWYNEKYHGYGSYDLDYNKRFVKAGGKIIYYKDLNFLHVGHEKMGDGEFRKPWPENKKYQKRAFRKYDAKGVYKLEGDLKTGEFVK